MMTFWIAASSLLCIAAALLLIPLLRRHSHTRPAGSGSLEILREQFQLLNQELTAGKISAEQHALAIKELEERVVEEVGSPASSEPPSSGRATKTAWAVGLLLPMISLAVYTQLGNPKALNPVQEVGASTEELDFAKVNGLVEQLAQRMAQEPNNLEGWTRLARAYAMLQQYERAQKAYEHAISISPPDAQLLADLADVLAMLQGQSVLGEPEQLIQRALKIDPHHVKALALAGSAAFEKQHISQAIEFWTQALHLAPPESELAKALRSSLAIAQAPSGSKAEGAVATPARITGIVRLSPTLSSQANPDDAVFVFARASEGPRMPLAILRATVKDLPLQFTLDDSYAMSPASKLSQFKTVIVGARISKSGQATPQSGDLIGQTGSVSHDSQGLEVLIHEVQP